MGIFSLTILIAFPTEVLAPSGTEIAAVFEDRGNFVLLLAPPGAGRLRPDPTYILPYTRGRRLFGGPLRLRSEPAFQPSLPISLGGME